MKINLSPDRLKSLDPDDMLGKTLELPAQIATGIALGREFLKSHALKPVTDLDWCGLGGSAVAGDLLQGLGYEPPAIPLRIRVNRYPRPSGLPRLVSSYSGNTVESVYAFQSAAPSQVWLSMSAGGKLATLAKAAGVPHLTLPGGYLPRAAVGFGLGAMLAIFDELYNFHGSSDFEAALPRLKHDAELYSKLDIGINPALEFAAKLVDRTPVVYTTDGLCMPALEIRFRAQLAENSKVWSHGAALPELAHNEVEALAFLGQLLPPPMVVFLGSWAMQDRFADPRPGLCKLLDGLGISHLRGDPGVFWKEPAGRVETVLRLMLLLDAATVYLAVLRAQNPAEIPLIMALKESLPVP
jgi:glucose/mannose-6-phosphate isomerase